MQNFIGKDNFVWWQGVVEDVDDPLMLGRCRVRVLGFHSDDKSLIKTEDLPWAYPIQPITSAAISGMGHSPTGLVPGSWVMGFFRDGENAQEPIMMGSIGGIPEEEADNETGFNDPRTDSQLEQDPVSNMLAKGYKVQKYPDDGLGAVLVNSDKGKSYPKDFVIDESDTNRLARNEEIDKTIVEIKRRPLAGSSPGLLDMNVPTSDCSGEPVRCSIKKDKKCTAKKSAGGKWTEPKTAYKATYPHNHVYESESGHTIEVDDTPGRERLHRYHRSGTFEEIHPNGDKVVKVVRNDYTVVLKNECVHIDGWTNVTMDKGCKIIVNKDKQKKEEGGGEPKGDCHFDIHVGENANINLDVKKGNVNAKLGEGDVNVELADGNMNTHVNGNYDAYVSGDYNVRVDGQIQVQSGKNQYYNAGPDIHLNHPGYYSQ
jgi:hypothetical protein